MRFFDIRNNEGQGKCYQPSRTPRLITLTCTKTFIILNVTKTKFNNNNNCIIIHCF